MTKITENFFVRGTVLLTIFLNVCGALNFFVPSLKLSFTIFISLILSPILAPNIRSVYISGEQRVQMKWIFFKKPLIFNC